MFNCYVIFCDHQVLAQAVTWSRTFFIARSLTSLIVKLENARCLTKLRYVMENVLLVYFEHKGNINLYKHRKMQNIGCKNMLSYLFPSDSMRLMVDK